MRNAEWWGEPSGRAVRLFLHLRRLLPLRLQRRGRRTLRLRPSGADGWAVERVVGAGDGDAVLDFVRQLAVDRVGVVFFDRIYRVGRILVRKGCEI